MPKVTENTDKLSSYDNFPPYLLSDTASVASVSRPDSKQSEQSAIREIPFRLMAERILRVVRSRRPKAFQPNPEQAPSYLVAYVTETLECGHKLDVDFIENAEPLIAKHRSCQECAALHKKKPSQSVRPDQKRQAGFSPWFSIGWATLCASLLVLAVSSNLRHTYTHKYPENYLRVIRNVDPCKPDGGCGYRFVVQSVIDGIAQPETEMQFCTSLQPRFEAGHILQWIRYTNVGYCNSIDGYDVVRGSDTLPILAPNCKPDYTLAPIAGHIVCEGGRANF